MKNIIPLIALIAACENAQNLSSSGEYFKEPTIIDQPPTSPYLPRLLREQNILEEIAICGHEEAYWMIYTPKSEIRMGVDGMRFLGYIQKEANQKNFLTYEMAVQALRLPREEAHGIFNRLYSLGLVKAGLGIELSDLFNKSSGDIECPLPHTEMETPRPLRDPQSRYIKSQT